MNPRDEEEVWRDIVDNYGDPPVFDEPEAAEPVQQPSSADEADTWRPVPWEDEGRFVPPTAPPVQLAEPPRLAAWLGVFVAPFILLVAVVLGWSFPSWLSVLLVGWFVGGFGYLVWTMQSGPRDPGDDGARI